MTIAQFISCGTGIGTSTTTKLNLRCSRSSTRATPPLETSQLAADRLLGRDQAQPLIDGDRGTLEEQAVGALAVFQRDAQAGARPAGQHQRGGAALHVQVEQRDMRLGDVGQSRARD